ncbi:ABC-2 type transport system ATP-binding protein [Jeotgalicoccus aerolatus]|nr:ABC-2 type transport system ATP-binding protein [Jeotgalicoccus aerolatus]
MALEISNLTKVFGEQTAVDSININVPDGSMYGFLGGNGAGKTTTFRMILK